MRLLYFGTYERDYPRNAQVIASLREAGVEVVEQHASVWERRRHKWAAGPGLLAGAALAQVRLAFRRRDDFDAIIVGYPGHLDVPLARRIAATRPLVFNPLVSLHDTLVEDRARFSRGSAAARLIQRVDRLAFSRADLVIADTKQHARFFSERFQLAGKRVAVCFVGAEERLFRPGWSFPAAFHVLFVGKLIPLHGLETILDAAARLPRVAFRIVGSGQQESLLRARPRNVEWVRWADYGELPGELHRAGCALGVFGTSEKAGRVIPNKAFQALACGTPLVTAGTAAARELLADGRDALLVPPGDGEALAAAIRLLAENAELATRIGHAGRATYEERASQRVLGRRWRALIEALLSR